MTPPFESWQWTLLFLGAFCVGLSKTGLPGLGVLFVALFANAVPARAATGLVLPLLLAGDLLAVTTYRRHLDWLLLSRLFPWTAAGVVIGWLALGRLTDAWCSRMIGSILVVMLLMHLLRNRRAAVGSTTGRTQWWIAAGTGVLAGFCTLVANAAGPVMTIYLLAMRLEKLDFMGTAAAFFLLLNWFKVPFVINLGLITPASLHLDLWLLPGLMAGALAGRWALGRVDQRWFERVALALAACAALKLMMP